MPVPPFRVGIVALLQESNTFLAGRTALEHFQADLLASPQDGDPKGSASRFIATDERFGKEQEFEGTVSGVIDGKPYLGDFKEEPHADHDHGKK